MKRIRTIQGAVDELHQLDPDCAVTEHCLRSLVRSGQIVSARSGAKYLVAVEDVLSYFGADSSSALPPVESERLTIKSQAPKQNFREKF